MIIKTMENNKIIEINKKESIYSIEYYNIQYKSINSILNPPILDIDISYGNMRCIIDTIIDYRFISLNGYIEEFSNRELFIVDFNDIYKGKLIIDIGREYGLYYIFYYHDNIGNDIVISINDHDIGVLSMEGRLDRLNIHRDIYNKNLLE